jgi:acyl-CoA synthetase (AMP-forming)/AMP-acid ligase II
MSGVNTLYNALLNNPDFRTVDFSNLRFAVSGGMATQATVAKAWKDLTTIFGVAEVRPSKLQECAWDIQTPHPTYPGFTELRADPVSGADCDELYGRSGDPQLPPRN